MAKILQNPTSGSIANHTHSHNRAGQYIRNRRTPVIGTRTPRQAIVKANLTTVSQEWQNLTALQMDAWASYADGHPIVDALGSSIKLTGHAFFVKVNTALLNVDQPLRDDPPTSDVVVPVASLSFFVSAAGNYTVLITPGTPGDFIAVAVSKTTSFGVNFQKTFTQVTWVDADDPVIDLSALALPVTGTLVTGQKAWVRLTPVSAQGLTGSALILQTRIGSGAPLSNAVLTSPVATEALLTWTTPVDPIDIVVEVGPSSGGPWTFDQSIPGGTSPQVIAGLTTGDWVRVWVMDPANNIPIGPIPAVQVT